MGPCISCLRQEEEEFGETTSLLRNESNQYDSLQLQQEMKKKQQRQQELNNLVNELLDNLIDMSSFITNTTLNSNAGSTEGVYPYYVTKSEKDAIIEDVKTLDVETKNKCVISDTQALYLKF